MAHVFIAPRIKVGFQNREGTFTGKLAYIIYFDDKGQLRKSKSWESWRDKSIQPEEFDNKPIDGFTINKDIKRYNGEWFSSTRTMIRVHDPRGFEFEVTTENLIAILMHTDCLRRGLIGEFVYAWIGKELVLLPTNSEEYQNAVKFTTNLSKKVKAKELVPGVSYKTKREGDVVFMGKLNWYEYNKKGRYGFHHEGLRQENKVFVFTKDEGESFFYKKSVEFLAEPNSDVAVSNFAELMEKFNEKTYANPIVKYEFVPVAFNPSYAEDRYNRFVMERGTYYLEKADGWFVQTIISAEAIYNSTIPKYEFKGYFFNDSYYDKRIINAATGEIANSDNSLGPGIRTYSYTSYNIYNRHLYTAEDIQKIKFYDFYVTFANGKRIKTEIYNL